MKQTFSQLLISFDVAFFFRASQILFYFILFIHSLYSEFWKIIYRHYADYVRGARKHEIHEGMKESFFFLFYVSGANTWAIGVSWNLKIASIFTFCGSCDGWSYFIIWLLNVCMLSARDCIVNRNPVDGTNKFCRDSCYCVHHLLFVVTHTFSQNESERERERALDIE